jgi:hypothetical protein
VINDKNAIALFSASPNAIAGTEFSIDRAKSRITIK